MLPDQRRGGRRRSGVRPPRCWSVRANLPSRWRLRTWRSF